MLEYLKLLFANAKISITHNPIKGFKAEATGPLGVIAIFFVFCVVVIVFAASFLLSQ